MIKSLFFVSLCFFSNLLIGQAPPVLPTFQIKGLNFTATPDSISTAAFQKVKDVGANWLAVIPYAYNKLGSTSVRYNLSNQWWWGETPDGIRWTIRKAHEKGLKTLIKPQVYVPGSWPGEISFDSEEDWQLWQESYKSYILQILQIAVEEKAEMFCIGTELQQSAIYRSGFWESLIKEIRQTFPGKLIYAANWDRYEEIQFWSELDFIGIDAYFPLVESKTPSVKELIEAWKPHHYMLKQFSETHEKSIVFTEFGYLSVDQCAHRPWERGQNIRSRPINEVGQANAIAALLEFYSSQPYWTGGFLWKWFPDDQGHEGYPERDFTPQGKVAESILNYWFLKHQ